jgi:cytochrome c553
MVLVVLGYFNMTNKINAQNSLYDLGEKLVDIAKSDNPDQVVDLIDHELDIDKKALVLESFLQVKESLFNIVDLKDINLFNVVKQKDFVYFIITYKDKFYIIKSQVNDKNQINDHFALINSKTNEMLSAGQKIYKTRCYSCHGKFGKGSIGPNLTDTYWKYVTNGDELYGVISNGKKGTMMIAYKDYLKPDELKAITLYIKAIQGKKIASGKKPEGKNQNISFNIINF